MPGSDDENYQEFDDDGVPEKKREDGTHEYEYGGYHPVHIGELYNDRYLVLGRLGAGAFSVVWLVGFFFRVFLGGY